MASVHGLNFLTPSRHSVRFHAFREKKSTFKVVCGSAGDLDAHEEKKGDKKKLKVLIAGGGIAGLVFALAAKRNGFDVSVFEKDLTAVRGEGKDRGPIQLLSSALGLLESIDKDATRAIMEAGYVTGNRNNGLADGTTGEWFAKFDFLTPAIHKGFPVTQIICRMELQRILLNAVGNDIVINNSKVVDFVNDDDKVTVFLNNGQQCEGDLLVGADGMRSRVRTKLFGHQEPKYSNFICYTGVAEFHPHYFPHFGYASIKYSSETTNTLLPWILGRGGCNGMPLSGRRVTALFPPQGINICFSSVLENGAMRWGKGRVILLGDAAHAMLPNLGQGGSMAIEDCYWLVFELQNLAQMHPIAEITSDELSKSFRRFENKRMFRVKTVHSMCRIASVMTSIYQTYLYIGPFPLFNMSALRVKHPAVVFGNKVLQLALPKFMDWVVVGQ